MAKTRTRILGCLAMLGVLLGLADPSLGFGGLLAPGDLKVRYRFDEGSGTSAADASGTGNTGTLTGATWVTGQVGQGISLDGTDDYVSGGTTGLPTIQGAKTLAYWMNVASVPSGTQCALELFNGTSGALQAGFRGGKIAVWGYGGGVLIEAAAPSAGAWHQVTYTYDGSTHRLYVGGVQVATSTTGVQSGSVSTFTIGRWNAGAQEYFAGSLDDVRVYTRALEASEVAGLAHTGALEALFKLDEGSGTSAADTSGNDNDGTLVNGPTWVAGKTGNAVSLDGTDDHVTCGTMGLPAINGLQTVAWWMNVASNPSSTQCAIDLHNDAGGSAVQLGFRNGNVTAWNHGGSVLAQATPPTAGSWHHYAYSFDGTTHRLYVNGTLANSTTATAQTGAVTSLTLGRWNGGPGEYFGGSLDELRIYSRVLSADEIAGLAGGTGTGLAAVYYDNMDWTGSFITRTDSQVNFNWGSGSPDGSIGADSFSAVWTGQVQPQWSETYTFYTNTDDGVRLWVNGQLVVDYPQDQAPTERSGQIQLSGGVKYNLRMEYFENGGGAQAELRWSSSSTPKALIPQSQLYPTDTTAPQILAATSNSSDLTKVYVRFSEAMAKSTVETTGNWTLSGGLTVSSVALSSDKRVATITASGSVTLGTTQVTAASSILGITQEALAAPLTHTIVDGNSQGIPGSTAITLIMTTDGNHSTVMFNEPSSHGVSQGVGEVIRIEVPGTTATTVTLRQVKKQGGRGQVNFHSSGTNPTATATSTGGATNIAFVDLRHLATSAFGGDITVEALVSGEVRGAKDLSAVELSFSTRYAYVNDQSPFTVTATVSPALENLELTNKTFAMDFGGPRDGTTPTTILQMPAWSLTNASGQATRTYTSPGVNAFLYDVIQLKRPMSALFGTIEGAKYCNKKKIIYTCYNSYEVDDTGSSSVKVSDGEKKLQYRDLVIKGRGFAFVFNRNYLGNTLRNALATASGGKVVKDFGNGWTFSYTDDYLLKDGSGSEETSNYVVYRADQISSLFVNIASGSWVAGQDEFTRLLRNASTGDFEIREPSGLVRIYHNFSSGATPNKNGRLKALEDRNGNRITFHYEQIDPDNTVSGDEKMVLAYAIDTLGREIRYCYFAKTAQTVGGRQVTEATTNAGAYGRLFNVRDFKGNMDFDGTANPDFTGQDTNRQLQFGYDVEGNLVKARTPLVLATPNGNDFTSGRATRYKYYTTSHHPGFTQTQWDALTQAQRDRLFGKLTHIWYPNEVKDQVDTDPADADVAEAISYETNTSSRFYGYATSYTIGGQNGNGVPSGGTITYTHTDLDPTRSLGGHPYNGFLVASHKTAVTDRSGNQAEYVFSAEKTLMTYKEFPRGLRSGEPASFETQETWNGQALLRGDRLKTRRTNPEGDLADTKYNDGATDRLQQANRIRSTQSPGTRGGDQSTLETVTVYEPIFNQPWLSVSARGSNSGANGFTAPVADPASRTMTDPYDATKTLNLRYAKVDYYDYQESTLASTAWGATSSWTPTTVDSVTVKATEVLLVRKLALPEANDTERTDSIRTVRTRLSTNLVKLGLGDLNGDGVTDPAAGGNVIRTAYGSPVLLANLNQHAIETTIDASDLIDQTKSVVDGGTQEGTHGGRLQTIVWLHQYNAYGQLTKTISPEGNVSTFAYYPENDADGDTLTTPAPADGRTLGTTTGGYLKETLQDTTRSYVQQTSGTMLSGGVSNNNTNPSATDIKTTYTYDDVGVATSVTDPRGIRTDYFVNELGEIVQTTSAADVAGAASASPSDPLYNHSDTQQKLTAYAFKSRVFRDYAGQVVLFQTEDRGNTSSVDGSGLGSLPSQATGTTPGLSTADASGGGAYVDHLTLYDRLGHSIETRREVDSTRSLNTRYRYDGNGRTVLVIHPEGNADSTIYDERDLAFQQIRGASSRPSAGKYASGDPTAFDRPGGSGTTPSVVTMNYDKDGNLIEVVDSVSNGGTSSTIAGAGDVIAKYTYDGYNRRKTVTDALGNKTTYAYDPDSNVVRVIQDGDPVDDVAGASENKTLVVDEAIHDELGRVIASHRVLFATPDVTTSRTSLLTDTPDLDSLAAYLSDASSDTASVPGATGITVIGRMTTLREYDREGRGTFSIQDDLDVNRHDFDGAGRMVKDTDSILSNGFSGGAFNPSNISGNTAESAYDDHGNRIEVKETDITTISGVAAETFRTTFLYDSLNRLQTAFDNLGLTQDVRYDSRSNAVARADAVGSVSSRSFARRGLGSTAAVTLNSYGNVIRTYVDGLGRTLETETRLTSSGQGDGTNIGATLEGVKTTAPTVDSAQSGDGLISVYYAYDDNSQILGLRDDNGNVTGYLYDTVGRQRIERKGLGVTGTTFSLSGGDSGAFSVALRGGVSPVDTESTGTDVTRTYNADSQVTTIVDEAGNSFACSYDALNRKKSCTITPASGYIGTTSQSWKFDGLSRMTEDFDNNGSGTADDVTCTYAFDSMSRKVEETQKIGSGSLKAITFDYELDCGCGGPSANLANKLTYPDGRQVKSLFDRLDRLVSRNDVDPGVPYTNYIAKYEYLGKGRVATLTYQNSVRLTHIGQVSSQNADVGFDGNRRIVNHRWESFTTGQALGAGTLVVGFEHQDASGNSMYDRANNKRIEYKTHDPGNSEQYKYDSAYRLSSTGSGSQGVDARGFERGTFTSGTRTSMAGGVGFYQDWDLEGLGNWARQDDNARVETRTSSDYNEIVDRVVSGNTATLSHDKNGNTIETGYTSLGGQTFPGGGLRLEWDALNRLRKAWKNNNTPGNTADDVLVGEYTYDAGNRRMRKVVTNSGSLNGTTDFYYEGWRVLEERDGSDAPTNQYVYGNYLDEVWTLDDRRSGTTVASLNDQAGSNRHFYLANTLYSVYGLTNEGSSSTPGALKEAYQYDAYGRHTVITDGNDSDTVVNFSANDPRISESASMINGSSQMYTGQRFDPEVGSVYFKTRYQMPALGTFLSRDQQGPSALQLYEYVGGQPINYSDPLGAERCCVDKFEVSVEPKPVGKSARSVLDGIEVPGQIVGQNFTVTATFKNTDTGDCGRTPDCRCHCCHYKQLIKGKFLRNGKVLNQPLRKTGDTYEYVSPTELREDTYRSGGPLEDKFQEYGVRSAPGTDFDKYTNPDRPTGCQYDAKDAPSIFGQRGDVLELDLVFHGYIFDSCRNLSLIPAKSWQIKVGPYTVR